MTENQLPKPFSGLSGLLCQETLSLLNDAQSSDVSAREGVKELLYPTQSPDPTKKQEPIPNSTPTADSEMERWEHCLSLLVEDFLERRGEISKLNKARKSQIEELLCAETKSQIKLEEAISARVGSTEQEALQLFAYQVAVFHFLQILLMKRWVDLGLILEDPLAPNKQTMNWQITSFLKKNCPKRMMGRHDWSFLKQNLYSWYSPTKEVIERLRMLLQTVNLSRESAVFPVRLLRTLGSKTRLGLLGFSPSLIDTKSLWSLLLEQKSHDMRMDSIDQLPIENSGAILISGLCRGDGINALREFFPNREINGIWAFTNNDLERYLSEILILWASASEIPDINIHSRSLLQERNVKNTPLFNEGIKIPYNAQLAACFPDADGHEMIDACGFLDQLKENGLLLIASDHFWPTENTEKAQKMREAVLRLASVRLILDLRQLSGGANEKLPKGIFILEKCTSKELRDSNRPQIIRMRGRIYQDQFKSAWATVIQNIRKNNAPGDVIVNAISNLGEGAKIETMAAAASQQQLKSSPWVTLSDPYFYEITARLKHNPNKAFTLGMIHRMKPGLKAPTTRGILLQEREGKVLQAATLDQDLTLDNDSPRHLFIPAGNAAESPNFYMAQILSAPIQFWYRLELEQPLQTKHSKGLERQSDQRLKLMPLVGLFEPGSLLPVNNSHKPFESIESLKRELTNLFKNGLKQMSERARLHQIIITLENTITQQVQLCEEFTKYLFPELSVRRWDIPSHLPDIAPATVFEIFRHLDKCTILQHPSVHLTRLRPVHDFKVTSAAFTDSPLGAAAELKIFHGIDAVLKFSGPSLILKAAYDEVQKRIGRPWLETADKLNYPTDFLMMQTQLREVLRTSQQLMTTLREYNNIMDQIFCCLFGLASKFDDEGPRQAIRRHLTPDDSRIQVQFQKEVPSHFKLEDSESPTGILQ